MNCRLLLLLPFTLMMIFVQAQNFSPAKDAAALQKKMNETSKKINSIQCNFVQEKNVSMLTEKSVAKGKFYFKRESKVLLDYQTPVKNQIVMNGNKLVLRDGKTTTEMDVNRSRVFKQLNNIIMGSINGSLFSAKDFSVQLFENTTSIKAELKPDLKTMKKFISTVVIVLDKKDFTATRIEMNETSGDNTILTFTNKVVNGNVDDALFDVK